MVAGRHMKKLTLLAVTLVMAAAFATSGLATPGAAPEQALDAAQLVQVALEANPEVRAARARWVAAMHAIKQHYAPADPLFAFFNIDSPTNGFTQAAEHSLAVQDSFQFPGKAILQARQAERSAEIARLMYQATVRDVRARVETAYYQALLDSALLDVNANNIESLRKVMGVTQVAYTAGRVTQTDFITAEFDVATAQRAQRQLEVALANDKTSINQLLNRNPDAPLPLELALKLVALKPRLDTLVDLAFRVRQEILETALTVNNSETAVTLAKLEYAPDYTLGYAFDHFLIPSAGPTMTSLQDHTLWFQFNLPIFFWLKENEDIALAKASLEAARHDLTSVKNQTAASVTTIYRSAQFAYENAQIYDGSLIPLARQDFEVAVVAYSSGRIDFITLRQTLARHYDSEVVYLQNANQFLAGKVALEQAIGAPLAQ